MKLIQTEVNKIASQECKRLFLPKSVEYNVLKQSTTDKATVKCHACDKNVVAGSKRQNYQLLKTHIQTNEH